MTGSVEPYRIARLASPAEGPVVAVHVREADPVEAGDVLASIGRKRGVDALIASLREELDQERTTCCAPSDLVESEAIAGERTIWPGRPSNGVRAQLIRAEETARDFDIVAPWDGIVSRLLVREGEFVSPRAAILEIYDPSSLEIRAAVAEQYAVEIAPGMRVEVRLDAYPGREFMGTHGPRLSLPRRRACARGPSRSSWMRISISAGMFARVDVAAQNGDRCGRRTHRGRRRSGRGPVVFVVEDGKAVRRSVETGIEQDNASRSARGSEPGDQVVVAGNQKLKDGAAVQLQNAGSGPRPRRRRGADGPSRRASGRRRWRVVKLTRFAVERRLSTSAILAALLVLGVVGLSRLPVDFLPSITYPMIKVHIWWRGATPEEIDRSLADPIERQMATVDHLDYLESSAIEGMYTLLVNFKYGVDVNVAYQDALAAMARVARELPDDIDPPVIIKADPSQLPVVQLTISSEQWDLIQLRTWAEEWLQDQLLAVRGVAGTEIVGGLRREIRVHLDAVALEKHGLALADVLRRLREENVDSSAGG